jgi:predicted enzyme related to lactoylglutathione lyase
MGLGEAMVVTTVPVMDLEVAKPFYRDVLGLALLEVPDRHHGPCAHPGRCHRGDVAGRRTASGQTSTSYAP